MSSWQQAIAFILCKALPCKVLKTQFKLPVKAAMNPCLIFSVWIEILCTLHQLMKGHKFSVYHVLNNESKPY